MDNVLIRSSTTKDGSMKFEWGEKSEIVNNIEAFLSTHGIRSSHTVNLFISGATSWDVIRRVHAGQGGEGMTNPQTRVPADALITDTKGLALFLPTADCYPTIIYDSRNNALGLLHLGWQSTAAHLAAKVVKVMSQEFNSAPADMNIYFGPGIKKESYRFKDPTQLHDPSWLPYLEKYDDNSYSIDLLGYNKMLFIDAGVNTENIQASNVDTATDARYFSNFGSNNLGKSGLQGRFGTVAMMHK